MNFVMFIRPVWPLCRVRVRKVNEGDANSGMQAQGIVFVPWATKPKRICLEYPFV